MRARPQVSAARPSPCPQQLHFCERRSREASRLCGRWSSGSGGYTLALAEGAEIELAYREKVPDGRFVGGLAKRQPDGWWVAKVGLFGESQPATDQAPISDVAVGYFRVRLHSI